MKNGLFITFEGLEGAGKSTQAEMLVEALKKEGYPVTHVREPGGTAIGEKIRQLLIAHESEGTTPLTECFLFAASRCQLVEQVIKPHLSEGSIVICDRFNDATVAYQGYGRKVHLGQVHEINELCSWGVVPDMTILLDLDPTVGLGRVRMRSAETLTRMDRFENLEFDFYERVREGYLEMAHDEPFRYRILEADQSPEKISSEILRLVLKEAKKHLPDPRKLKLDVRQFES